MLSAQAQGDYTHYYSTYMGDHPDYQKYIPQQGGQQVPQGGNQPSQQGPQGGNHTHYYGQGRAYSQYYMPQSGSQHQDQRPSGTGFEKYMDRYVPSNDTHITHKYTSGISDQTATAESTGSTGPNGYNQFVDKYSSGPDALAAAKPAVMSSAGSSKQALSLAASPTQTGPETQPKSTPLVACIFAAFSVPAALAFVSKQRRSRLSKDLEDAGFQRLIEV
jgi:hypothetical protein